MLFSCTKEKFLLFLFSILPISIILGATVSLINILLMNIYIIYLFFREKFFFVIKNKNLSLLFFLNIYLLINSIISIDFSIGILRNIGFFRFILLFIFVNYLFNRINYNFSFFKLWFFIILIFTIDVFIESYFGSNIFGWGAFEVNGVAQPNGNRIVSFFKDEPIAGAYLIGFAISIIGYAFNNYKDKKYLIFLTIFIFLFALILTGERSNTIKAFISFFIFFIFLDFIKIKTKLVAVIIITVFSFLIILNSSYLKNRYFGQFLNHFESKEKFFEFTEKSQYFQLYKSGFEVFKNYPFMGVGNKNYRIETCGNQIIQEQYSYKCMTHPHQFYFEILAEHGLVGSTILIGILIFLMSKILNEILLTRNYLQLGTFSYVITVFIPLLPSGSFFSDFNSTLFWINFSIMFACNKNTNIFTKI